MDFEVSAILEVAGTYFISPSKFQIRGNRKMDQSLVA